MLALTVSGTELNTVGKVNYQFKKTYVTSTYLGIGATISPNIEKSKDFA